MSNTSSPIPKSTFPCADAILVALAVVADGQPWKRCPFCKRGYTATQWGRLRFIGELAGACERIETRECAGCGANIGVITESFPANANDDELPYELVVSPSPSPRRARGAR